MKICCLSDTELPERLLKDYLTKAAVLISRSDLLVHLGDGSRDFQKLTHLLPNIPTIFIKGNHDKVDPLCREFVIKKVKGRRFLFTHGSRTDIIGEQFNIWGNRLRKLLGRPLNMKDYYNKLYCKYHQKYDVVIYGHTHIPKFEKIGKTVFFCPGAFTTKSPLKGHFPCFGIIDTYSPSDLKKSTFTVYQLDKGGMHVLSRSRYHD